MTRDARFMPFRVKARKDPHPDTFTAEDREHIHEKVGNGSNIAPRVVLKLLRLYDEAVRELAVCEQGGRGQVRSEPSPAEEAERLAPMVGDDVGVALD